MRIPVSCVNFTMEENSPSQNINPYKSSSGGIISGNKPNEEGGQKVQYSIPGILHFIQHEWARFEMERSQWEVDRAELLARIAFLQGERKGQENLKNDLVRRIKMLEYALKQERAKYHKLKYGTDLVEGDMKAPSMEDIPPVVAPDRDVPFSSVSNITWKQGRQMLRQYLQEIGYTESILDVRSNLVKSLLGLNNNEEGGVNGDGVRPNQERRSTPARRPPQTLTEAMVVDTEDAVMANFEFLGGSGGGVTRPDLEDDDQEEDMEEDLYDHETTTIESKQKNTMSANRIYNKKKILYPEGEDLDAEAEEVLNELNLLTQSESSNVINDVILEQKCADWGSLGGDGGVLASMKREAEDSTLGLGELAQLTVNNDADSTYDMSSTKEAFRKTWNAKYTLRSHFDGVRALAFHPTEAVLVTASEDHTLKLWNLAKTLPAKKSASLDVEPLYTFRGHTGPVLTLAVAPQGDTCYSGGLDGFVHCWTLPSPSMDPYDSYEPSVLDAKLSGHQDAVWRLVAHPTRPQLLSASADGTVKLWSTSKPNHLLNTYSSEADGIPTSVDFARDESDKMVCAFSSGQVVLYDLETARPITRLESGVEVGSGGNTASGGGVYRVVCHPLVGVSVTAHEDRTIRFLDHTSGKLVHSMVAHLDAVTCLAVDPNALYLLSGSHDCSIRLWNLDNKTCVQEITAHRKKFDESILDIAFHPTKPFIASAGADALAKVFV